MTPAEAITEIMASHVGRENAVKFAALKYQVNRLIYPDVIGERALREIIERDKKEICFCTAGPGGYFLPSENPEVRGREVRACIRSLDNYERNIRARKEAIVSAYPNEIQGDLFAEAEA